MYYCMSLRMYIYIWSCVLIYNSMHLPTDIHIYIYIYRFVWIRGWYYTCYLPSKFIDHYICWYYYNYVNIYVNCVYLIFIKICIHVYVCIFMYICILLLYIYRLYIWLVGLHILHNNNHWKEVVDKNLLLMSFQLQQRNRLTLKPFITTLK